MNVILVPGSPELDGALQVGYLSSRVVNNASEHGKLVLRSQPEPVKLHDFFSLVLQAFILGSGFFSAMSQVSLLELFL